MGKFTGYLICTDCDGTLTYDVGKVSDENAEAIKYFQNEGGMFTLATGRFPDHAELFQDKLQINAPMVSLNGTMLYDIYSKSLINKWPMETESCYELLFYIKKNWCGVWDYWMNGVSSSGEFFSNGYKPGEHSQEDDSLKHVLADFPSQMLKMVVVSPDDVTLAMQKDLKKKFGDRFRFDTSWANGLEIQDINSGKGVAVQYMKEHFGTRIHTTIGIGDYENDISLLQSSDIGYAVDNAIDIVKKIADRITVSNTENAIAKVIMDLEKEV